MRKFVVLAMVLVIVKVADIGTTWLYTPDFSLTINPLGSVLPFWGFLVFQAAALVLLVFGMYLYLTKPFPRVEGARSLREFWSIALFGESVKTVEWFTKMPKNWSPFGFLLGFAAVFVALPVGGISIVSNLLCLASGDYLLFFRRSGQIGILGFTALLSLIAVIVFVRSRWRDGGTVGPA